MVHVVLLHHATCNALYYYYYYYIHVYIIIDDVCDNVCIMYTFIRAHVCYYATLKWWMRAYIFSSLDIWS